jgi:hypothetical protein
MSSIGWHTYILLAGWNMVQAVFIYFFAVETNKKTLEELTEELTEVFITQNPRKRSPELRTVLVSDSTNQAVYAKDQ